VCSRTVCDDTHLSHTGPWDQCHTHCYITHWMCLTHTVVSHAEYVSMTPITQWSLSVGDRTVMTQIYHTLVPGISVWQICVYVGPVRDRYVYPGDTHLSHTGPWDHRHISMTHWSQYRHRSITHWSHIDTYLSPKSITDWIYHPLILSHWSPAPIETPQK